MSHKLKPLNQIVKGVAALPAGTSFNVILAADGTTELFQPRPLPATPKAVETSTPF